MSNENLRTAKKVKNDNFFTKYEDVENELSHYKDQLRDKIIYCNCDTPESNFVKFLNGIKDEWSIKDVWHTSIDEEISFDSEYAKELLSKCDIVISNPPFSKVRESYVPLLIESGKQFLFIGNLNMATMKEIFPLIRDGKMWTGYTHPKEFLQPDGTYKKFGNTLWWTNMYVDKPFALDCTKHFDESKYPMYDNYAAWNVDKVKDIPCDESIIVSVDEEKYHALVDVYKEDCLLLGKSGGKYIVEIIRPIWGVPVTFIEHYTPPCILRTGGCFGSDTLDSVQAQTVKTSERTDDTAICVTLSGNRCDLENRGAVYRRFLIQTYRTRT